MFVNGKTCVQGKLSLFFSFVYQAIELGVIDGVPRNQLQCVPTMDSASLTNVLGSRTTIELGVAWRAGFQQAFGSEFPHQREGCHMEKNRDPREFLDPLLELFDRVMSIVDPTCM